MFGIGVQLHNAPFCLAIHIRNASLLKVWDFRLVDTSLFLWEVFMKSSEGFMLLDEGEPGQGLKSATKSPRGGQ